MRKLTEAGLVPPTRDAEARARLRAWDERGHSPAWIASATGLTVEAVQHLTHDLRRYDRKIGRHIAGRILQADITAATSGPRRAVSAAKSTRPRASAGMDSTR